ncbi:MAG: HAMP domain-containing histidine kinase [Alphaproteobacteria bacterium]|nr:HAMP domain-containing histidine kinase [Alphaproteobacteria bacterium]
MAGPFPWPTWRGEAEVSIGDDASSRVGDHGLSVPLSDQIAVFEPFGRGQSSDRSGTGLGLAVVAETVAAHGGTVSVLDAVGGGAEFSMRLPQNGSNVGGDV